MRWSSGALSLALLAAACAAPPAELAEVPRPDPAGMEASVLAQLDERWSAVDRQLTAQPRDAKALAAAFGDLGLVLLLYDELAAAQVAVDNARLLEPAAARWSYLSGYLEGARGNLETAVERYQVARSIDPDDQATLVRLGRALLDLRRFDEAAECFAHAAEVAPRSAAAKEGLARVAVERGQPAEAARLFEEVLELEPRASSVHYALSQLFRQLGEPQKAAFHLERRGDVAVAVEDPLLAPLADQGRSVQFFLRQGAEALADEDWPSAVSAYRRALELDPHHLEASAGLATAEERQGNAEGAAETLRRAAELAVDADRVAVAERVELLARLAALEARRGELAGALASYRQALALAPDDFELRSGYADALAISGDLVAAVATYDELLAGGPAAGVEALARVKRGTALALLGRRADAVADFRRAVALTPTDVNVRLRFAELLESFGDSDAAEQQRAAVVEQAGDEGRALVQLARGRRLRAEGRPEQALGALEESVRLSPGLSVARWELAGLLGAAGRLDEAVTHFRRLVDDDPRFADARRSEITALVLAQRYAEARVRLEEAMRLLQQDLGLALLQARLLATCPDERVRDGDLAAAVAERLMAVRPADPRVVEVSALAQAAQGKPREASAGLRPLLDGATGPARERLAAEIAVLEGGTPWIARSPAEILDALR